MFAIALSEELWFKADKTSDAAWDDAGAAPFTYPRKDGKTGRMNYRCAPADCYDDPDALCRWGLLALDAGRRARR